MARRRDKDEERALARDRIDHLLHEAHAAARAGRVEDATRYGDLAWLLTTRYVVRAPAELKTRVCRSCHAYLLSGRTARTRVTQGKVSTTCLACGTVRRVPLTRERAARRKPA